MSVSTTSLQHVVTTSLKAKGMAVQIVSDLGLHLDLQHQYVALSASGDAGHFDDINALRINLFWACKTLDTYDAFLYMHVKQTILIVG